MKTVPTLCASATSIGASAVGLSFGRPASPHEVASASLLHQTIQRPERHLMPSSTADATSNLSPSSISTPSHDISRPDYDAPLQERRLRRRDNGDCTSRASTALDDLQIPGLETAPSTSRPGSSWRNRLSTLTSPTSLSRTPSPNPYTPSISNGSMAFSHDGSVAPIIGRPSPSPLPPNKLVKRSSSMRTTSNQRTSNSSRGPTFRRPATSHQRSVTLQYCPTLLEAPAEKNPSQQDVHYTHFFRTEVSADKPITKKRAQTGEVKHFKRLLPDNRCVPTLLLAKSVSTYTVEVDNHSDTASINSSSRPVTSDLAQLRHQSEPLPSIVCDLAEPEAETRPRRSFSVTDLIASGQQAWKQRVGKAESKIIHRQGDRKTNTATTRQALTTMSHQNEPNQQIGTENGHGRHTAQVTQAATNAEAPIAPEKVGLSETAQRRWSSPRSSAKRESMQDQVYLDDSIKQRPQTQSSVGNGLHRTLRHSLVSEPASTLSGSDNEARGLGSGDEDDLDIQSDTVFDSVRTRTTRSTSVSRGPHIEMMFNESPPSNKDRVLPLFRGVGRNLDDAENLRIAEEDEHVSSPARTATTETARENSPSSYRTAKNGLFNAASTSTPDTPKPLSLGTLEWDVLPEEEIDTWSFSGDEMETSWQPSETQLQLRVTTPVKSKLALAPASKSSVSTPRHGPNETSDRDTRSSIFDWSEQAPADKSPGNGTPPRPRTVHGKKDADMRGSRSVGRRAPSALHARSQSVPVVPDLGGKREPVVTNKFGTWGVGSKGVTEDWDDDFDFSPQNEMSSSKDEELTARVDSGFSMLVPRKIQEQQTKVLANIGLLREWGLLIEELKELRIRAATLDILDGQHKPVWEEVEAMIDLADQEVDEPSAPSGSPSFPNDFEADVFDERSSAGNKIGKARRTASYGRQAERSRLSYSPQHGRSRQKSVTSTSNGHEVTGHSPLPRRSTATPETQSHIIGRPRKGSEAVARSVIEALQKRRNSPEPYEGQEEQETATPARKVPFDTGTLKHIVPYVHGLMRKVKEAMREAEGLNISPHQSLRQTPKPMSPPHPPLSELFIDSNHNLETSGSPLSRKDLRVKATQYSVPDNDLAAQMKFMTVM